MAALSARAGALSEVQFDEAPQQDAYVETAIDRNDPQWYKDAVIYELHVKAFQDGSGDGIGDFGGLMERLDYIHDLGATAIWLLPFYPSPLRDDGYDIADYRSINSAYGDLEAFRKFVAEAHRRGLRVITELVINHTSDQHPWFQAARQAPEDSPERDFYVWSDTDERYAGTRIIFLDTESSNWTWDPVAKAYFWHRFYSHQPDLNFDNPRVFDEIVEIMHFWLEMGVDGLRLDAVPYLCEREGTNNENLPETHDVLRRIRAEVDARYPDRMLLAEANQWPEDTRPYFGDGDESHMAFHFPLMPRMYMALAQEDRHPITDILRQTPDIPEICQWAIFLRNHDELTLEMVTDEERDYLWQTYATDPVARINLGIRRRLAPLMDNNRRKIELMNALLLSMPGTPVIYYGDEIGMGDNFYLGDRDGVRTPMQWSADRNGGFSRADPQRLYLPPIMDPLHGYQAINVEAQQRDASSLLNWMRRIIAVRKQHKAFGRGSFNILLASNRKALAYIREHEDEKILCVANLAHSAQAIELDLSAFHGLVPVELTGRSVFPPIGELPYLLTLPGYGFYWFALTSETDLPHWHEPTPDPLPEFITVISSGSLDDLISGHEGRRLEVEVLPNYLRGQRWFGGKDSHIASTAIEPIVAIASGGREYLLTMVSVGLAGHDLQRYFLPLSVLWGGSHLKHGAPMLSYTLAKVRRGPVVGALVDAARDADFARAMVQVMRRGEEIAWANGSLFCEASATLREMDVLAGNDPRPEVRSVAAEQSNVSMIIGEKVILKFYRLMRDGKQPELEMARYLTDVAGFGNAPALLGAMELRLGDGSTAVPAAAFEMIMNQGDAWTVLVEALARELEAVTLGLDQAEATGEPDTGYGFPLDLGAIIGRRTAELHNALAVASDEPIFAPQAITARDIADWTERAVVEAGHAYAILDRADGEGRDNPDVVALLEARDAVFAYLKSFSNTAVSGIKTRIHGDYHLGQVLVSKTDVFIIDFEGEPRASLAERRARSSPVRDVAGMLRSFDYAASAAVARVAESDNDARQRVISAAVGWRDFASKEFLNSYEGSLDRSRDLTPASGSALLDLFLMQKAFYEVGYEAANRPGWLSIPVRGVLDLLTERGVL